MTIGEAFERCRSRREMALIPYLTAGFPTRGEFLDAVQTVVRCGADVVEIGVPFSDPIADGPTIQRSSYVALRGGTRLADVLNDLATIDLLAPLVVMSYLNPLLASPREELLTRMQAARISGLIIPDLPVEESDEWREATARFGIDLVQMAAPTSGAQRLAAIAQASRGFVYALSRAGTTGVRAALPPGLPDFLRELRTHASTPIAVGFGISTPDHVRGLHGLADGVVVGSRIVDALARGEDVGSLIASLKHATRGAG